LVTSGAFPRKKHLKGAPIGLALALPSNSKTWLARVSKDEPSSLLCLVVSDKGKKFYNVDTRRVWRAIYEENCFKPAKASGKDILLLQDSLEDMCLEKRAFYRAVSGLHSRYEFNKHFTL
jgi:hypothetical protein